MRRLNSGSHINKIISLLIIICVIYFSYLPFLYIIHFLQIDKKLLWAGIFLSTLFVITIKFLIKKTHSLKLQVVLPFVLYLFFAIYAFSSFALTPNYLNDIFNIRTVAFLNPIFILFALHSRKNKVFIIKLLFLFLFIYFIFFVYRFYRGELSISSDLSQTIFNICGAESAYQNINLYLGLFALFNMTFILLYQYNFLKILSYLMFLGSFIGTFFIGGRASVISLTLILLIVPFVLLRQKINKKHFFFTYFFLLLLTIVFLLLLEPYISESITIKRFMALSVIQVKDIYTDPSNRLFLFTKALELFSLNLKNIVFGAGINFFPVYIGEYHTGMYPHNIILELLAEYGLIGTALFFMPIFYILKLRKDVLGSIVGNSFEERTFFLVALYFWIIHMFTGGLRSSWMLIFFTYILTPYKEENPLVPSQAVCKFTCN